MNFKQFGSLLPDNPLCGIDTYKDELNLATGVCTRQIKKLVLTGGEDWELVGSLPLLYFRIRVGNINTVIQNMINSTHLPQNQITSSTTVDGVDIRNVQTQNAAVLNVRSPEMGTSTDDFKSYLAAQYAAGTPVIAWYALSEPTTETITVPSGLSGTEEGYLNQSGTPTPTNPIYPTANTVEKWFDINHYIMGTDTDTITTLPADIYANDTTATVGLKGNMEQSSTPTPTTPIQPQECGERTGNLLSVALSGGYNLNTTSGLPEQYENLSRCATVTPIDVSDYTSVTFSYRSTITDTKLYIYALFNGSTLIRRQAANSSGTSIDVSSGDKLYLCVYTNLSSADCANTLEKAMLNSGSTALPYEPWGIKIPILSNSTTTPVYLGEVQTTRRIKKLVLTGQETFNYVPSGNINRFRMALTSNAAITDIVSTHYKYEFNNSYGNAFVNSALNTITFCDDYSSETDFKAFLAQQYTNETPVTVWYVLAEPTTGIVNEPIRKIGDYADEVSGITIPTIAGANTLSIGTTLQPSEVSVNYHGWHPVVDVHERENGAWD